MAMTKARYDEIIKRLDLIAGLLDRLLKLVKVKSK